MTTLLFLDRLRPSPSLVERAEEAGDWILNHAVSKEGLLATRLFKGPDETLTPDGPVSFLFDLGMVGAGLTLVYRRTKKRRFLEGSLALWDAAARRLARPDGRLFAGFDAAAGSGVDSPEKWSTQTGAYHAKVALWLWALYEATSRNHFQEEARRFCERALESLEPEGRFITHRADRSTHLHPHCYAAEGLLVLGENLGERAFTEAAVRATEWALEQELEDGRWSSFQDGQGRKVRAERSDVIAQILRLASVLSELRWARASWQSKIDALTRRLLSFQGSENGSVPGGFRYGQDLDAVDRPHLNAWCSMFALQALAVASDRAPGKGRWRTPVARLALEYWV